MAAKESRSEKDSFVSRLVKDPSRPPETLVLQGFAGDAAEKGHRRLYLDLQLENWVDIPDELVLHTEDVRDPAGLPAAVVWVRRDAIDRLRYRTPTPGFLGPQTLLGPPCPPTFPRWTCPPTQPNLGCPPTFPRWSCPPTPFPVRCPPTPFGIRCPTLAWCPWPPGGGTLQTALCPWPPGGGTITTAVCPSAVDACPSAPGGCDWITPHIQTPVMQTPVMQAPEWAAGGPGAWGGGMHGGGFGAGGFGFGQ